VNDILQPTNDVKEEMAFSVTEASDDENNKEAEVRIILKSEVAAEKKLEAMNVEPWMDALIYKLNYIRVSIVYDVRKGIITLN
jgi:hypothetical protein